jgi:hypothetical protein
MEHRKLRITAETPRHRIRGTLLLPADGYRSRLTDYLNSPDRTYLPLTDVEIVPLQGDGPPEQRQFVALSLDHLVLAIPEEDEDQRGADAS